jgi:hypothetical protein
LKSSIFFKGDILLIAGSTHQSDEPLFVCRSSPFDGLDPHHLLRIVNLVKDMQIADAETIHVLEVPFQLLDMPVQVGISGNNIHDLCYSPSYGNPWIIVEKPKENNNVCQGKSLYR